MRHSYNSHPNWDCLRYYCIRICSDLVCTNTKKRWKKAILSTLNNKGDKQKNQNEYKLIRLSFTVYFTRLPWLRLLLSLFNRSKYGKQMWEHEENSKCDSQCVTNVNKSRVAAIFRAMQTERVITFTIREWQRTFQCDEYCGHYENKVESEMTINRDDIWILNSQMNFEGRLEYFQAEKTYKQRIDACL